MAQEEGYLNNPNAQYPDYPEQVAVGSYSYTGKKKLKNDILQRHNQLIAFLSQHLMVRKSH
jgi:hypothetical protein